MTGTVVIRINGIGAFDLTISANGSFTFGTSITSGAGYAVAVVTQPTTQTCTVTNGNGTVGSANITNVAVNCVTGTTAYTVGGTITGLTSNGLKLSLFNTSTGSQLEELIVAAGSTSFTFSTTFVSATGTNVLITDVNQPTGRTCIVGNPANQASTANITLIQVACAAKSTSTLQGTYRAGTANSGNRTFFTFYANGSYIHAGHENNAGNIHTDVEYGIYNWNSGTGVLTAPVILVDTDDMGLTDLHSGAISINMVASGSNLVATVHETGIADEVVTLYPVTNTSGSLVGVWSGIYPRDVLIYLADNTFVATVTGLTMSLNSTNSAFYNGIEDACYTATGGTQAHTISSCIVDTSNNLPGINANGNVGLINNAGTQPSWSYSVSGDTLTRTQNVSGLTQTLTRVQ
ncbi:MAG: hypothetical protein QM808_05390 [Steroidobacteraceae bacterium]